MLLNKGWKEYFVKCCTVTEFFLLLDKYKIAPQIVYSKLWLWDKAPKMAQMAHNLAQSVTGYSA